MYESLLILLFRQYYAIKIAADEIAENDACIYSKYLQSVEFPERNRHAEIIECIRHAVGEAAYDEERHTEEKRQVLLLAGKLYCCGHDESGCTCIKFQFITHYGQESEREEDGTCKGSISLSLNACSQETEASGSDSDTGEY